MGALDDLNSGFQTAYGKAQATPGFTDKAYGQSDEFKGYHSSLNDYYGGLSDPTAIKSELANQQGRMSDPNYGWSATELAATLQGRQKALAPPAAPGLTASAPTAPAPAPTPYKATGIVTGNPGQDTSGNYTPQNASVAARIPGLMSTDNPIVQAAVGQATRAASARGLQNSTMATQAGVQAAEASVLPIASQDAAQIAAQNLSSQNAAQTGALQEQQIGGTLQNTGLQTGSAQFINAQNIQATRDNLNTQISANQGALTQQLGSQATLQAAQLAMNKELQGQTLTAQEGMLTKQLDAAMAQLGLSTSTQLTIANTNVKAGERQSVATMSTQFAQFYSDAIGQINANKDMPAAARTVALTTAQQNYNSNMHMLEQLWNVQLTWTTTNVDGSKDVHAPAAA